MKLYDVSILIERNIPQWPGSIKFSHRFYNENTSYITLDLHTGTHIDAPKHFIKNGKSIDMIPLDKYFGKCQVVEIKNGEINYNILKHIELKEKKILFKTKNSKLSKNKFHENYTALTKDAAEYLVQLNVELIGIDYLSIEKYENNEFNVHKILLSNEIIVLEGLNLNNIKPGIYTLIAFPICIKDAEASPVRAVLMEG